MGVRHKDDKKKKMERNSNNLHRRELVFNLRATGVGSGPPQ